MIDFTLPAFKLAPRLLGCFLCVKDGDSVRRLVINETEAYYGEDDTACHAHRGKTERTKPMYERGGIAYIYLCYGMYEMLNVVSGPEGHAEAVLIRGAGEYNGPGKLTKALGITRALNTCDLSGDSPSDLWIEDREAIPEFDVSPRVGIAYAEKEDRERKWRFYVK